MGHGRVVDAVRGRVAGVGLVATGSATGTRPIVGRRQRLRHPLRRGLRPARRARPHPPPALDRLGPDRARAGRARPGRGRALPRRARRRPRRRHRAVGVPAPLHAAPVVRRRRAASSIEANRTDAWARHVDFMAETFGDLVGGWKPVNETNLYPLLAYRGSAVVPPGPRRPRRVRAASPRRSSSPPPRPRCGCAQTGAPVCVDLRPRRRRGRSTTTRRAPSAVDRVHRRHSGTPGSACSATACCAVPGREPIERPDLAGAFDLIGFSYYFDHRRRGRPARRPPRRTRRVSPLGYGICADGVGLVLDRLHEELPGHAAARRRVRHRHRRRRRARRLPRARPRGRRTTRIDRGIDVRGFFHWTSVDNYEWIHGYDVRFGIIDRDRNVKPSAQVLAREALGPADRRPTSRRAERGQPRVDRAAARGWPGPGRGRRCGRPAERRSWRRWRRRWRWRRARAGPSWVRRRNRSQSP